MLQKPFANVIHQIWVRVHIDSIVEERGTRPTWYKLVEAGKSKLQGGSMATFPVVPHLIMVFNFGGVKIPLDMLQTKWTWCRKWQNTEYWHQQYSPCENKYHPQSDESDWHPSPWSLSRVFLKWTLWKCGNLHKSSDPLLFGVEYQELCWWAQIQQPVSCYGDTNETLFLLLPRHVAQI